MSSSHLSLEQIDHLIVLSTDTLEANKESLQHINKDVK